VRFRVHAVLAVEAEAFAPRLPARRIAVERLDDACITFEAVRHRVAEVDQDVRLRGQGAAIADEHGAARRLGGRIDLVRHEAAVAKGPQHVIERACFSGARRQQQHFLRLRPGLLRQAAREAQPRLVIGLLEDIEVDASHARARGALH
jgi:hypothetical protein